MTDRIWILGAPDPEMAAIESLLRDCGERVVYALSDRGERVTAATAYRCEAPSVPAGSTVYAVECLDTLPDGWVRIDHHRPGDPGYGRPPEEFLPASSIGQVIAILRRHFPAQYDGAVWYTSDGGEPRDVGGNLIGMPYAEAVPRDIVLAAAADHCLGAAYRGECPGVDPDELMRWRAESRARFQGRSVEEVVADIERARAALRGAPTIAFGDVPVRDLRDVGVVPELPDAASRDGEAYLALVTVDGSGRPCRPKVVLGGCTTPEQVRAFLEDWAPRQGLVDCYGDPARGFAGGYLP